jgi:hypothetical protein
LKPQEIEDNTIGIGTSFQAGAKNLPHYNLRSYSTNKSLSGTMKEYVVEDISSEDKSFSGDIEIELEDLQGTTFEDAMKAIEEKNKPEKVVNWPNDAYRDFMQLVIDGNISNKIGDQIIKLFNTYSNLENSPLPKSTKSGKDYLNQIKSPSVDFKEKIVAIYSETNVILHYRPIFRSIQALLQRPGVTDHFVLKKNKNKNENIRIFGEQYECDWWLTAEKSVPLLQNLLSIILYSDATTFDGLGKTSGHPVFLTLGNLPNWYRNLPEAKVLLGFLPKIQDTGIKTSKEFLNFQRELYHKSLKIMLAPLQKKSDSLYFIIRGKPIAFTARISVIIADMLEENDITATYRSAQCKMPCHNCMVLRDDLNNMNIAPENMLPRTQQSMQSAINECKEKDFSIYSIENTFWNFP